MKLKEFRKKMPLPDMIRIPFWPNLKKLWRIIFISIVHV